ncbi:MAG: hypothetical protein AB7P76_11685 [Candidatus Melainabacteria bacterium]
MSSIVACLVCNQFVRKLSDFGSCEDCHKEASESYLKVHDYLQDYPGSTPDMVAEGTGVNKKLILFFEKQNHVGLYEKSKTVLHDLKAHQRKRELSSQLLNRSSGQNNAPASGSVRPPSGRRSSSFGLGSR